MKTVVVIPAFNEEKRIGAALSKIVNNVYKIIVVDDGSKDRTSEVASSVSNQIVTLRHGINLGKGAALKTGCEAAIKIGADIIVFMDADGQHDQKDIPRFVEILEKENYDIVFGSRIIGKDMPLVMMLGNKFLSIAMTLLFKIYVADTQSGFRAFKTSAYPKIKWNSTKYSVESEIIVNTSKRGLKYKEIEIQTIYHDDYKGTTIFDGIKIFVNLLVWKII